MDREVIDQYAQGPEKLKAAVRSLTRADFIATPAPEANVGLWSIQQVVAHLLDADLIWTARMKSIIAEENPQIIGCDESKSAANLPYDAYDIDEVLQLFEMNRTLFAKVLRKLPDSAFARIGQHNEIGQITLAQSVKIMANHVDHHVKFIHAKRADMGKEMW